jgi:hypothetical protein
VDRADLIKLASRIKARTRDVEVIALCDAALGGLLTSANAVSTLPANKPAVSTPPANRPKTDRRAYMRDLMRRRRAAARAADCG